MKQSNKETRMSARHRANLRTQENVANKLNVQVRFQKHYSLIMFVLITMLLWKVTARIIDCYPLILKKTTEQKRPSVCNEMGGN